MATLGSSLALAMALAASAQPVDGWITLKARLALVTSAQLSGDEVKVDTTDGKLTLFGEVSSTRQRDEAARLAQAVPGVTGVRNLLVVGPAEPEPVVGDAELKSQVQKALDADPALDDSDVRVKRVDQGAVRLTGRAQSLSDLVRAATEARGVEGVRSVATDVTAPRELREEELVLEAPVRPGLADARTGSEVKLQLLTADSSLGTDVDVDVRYGRVTLFGTVASNAAYEAAALLADDVDGVLSVENYLRVVPELEKGAVSTNDGEIEASLKDALGKRPELRGVDYTVTGGVAQLTGRVPDAWARLRALRLALDVPGVARVEQQIEVGPAPPAVGLR